MQFSICNSILSEVPTVVVVVVVVAAVVAAVVLFLTSLLSLQWLSKVVVVYGCNSFFVETVALLLL